MLIVVYLAFGSWPFFAASSVDWPVAHADVQSLVMFDTPPPPPPGIVVSRSRAALPANATTISSNQYLRTKVLLVIYTDSDQDTAQSNEISSLLSEVAQGREFFALNSRCRLDVEISAVEIINRQLSLNQLWLVSPPGGYWLPFWEVDGTHSVRNDLYGRGYVDNQFSSVVVYYAWKNTSSVYAAYGGGAYGVDVGFMGQTAYVAIPLCWDPTTNDWYFIHEFHHTLDDMFRASGLPEYPHADLPGNYNGGFDDGYSFNAWIQRSWPIDNWGLMSQSWGQVLSFADADGDSLPDSDAFLVLTEANIGSDPGQIDTDQDGLGDLAEATAGYFQGSDPNAVDTDGDDVLDGADRYPLDAADPIVHLSSPFLDGILSGCEEYKRGSFSLANPSDLRFDVYGCRLDTGIYLAVKVYDDTISCPWTEPWWDDNVRVMIDATNDGFLAHGDDNYSIYVAPTGQANNPRRSISIIHPDGSSDDLYIPSTDLRAYYRKEAAYYFVEMFIRENVLTSFHMAELDTFGLQVSVTDYDSYPGWPTYSVWSQFLDFSARAGTGIVAGSVESDNGQALGDVLIEAQGDISAATSTSLEGVYSLRELPCGTYALHFSRSGYHDTTIASTGVDRLDSTVVNIIMTSNFLCGDANADAAVDISDVVYLIAYIFSGGSAPSPLLAGDANCDAAVDISDVVYLIAYIFSGGLAPCGVCK